MLCDAKLRRYSYHYSKYNYYHVHTRHDTHTHTAPHTAPHTYRNKYSSKHLNKHLQRKETMSQALPVDQPRKKVDCCCWPLIERDIEMEKSKVFVEQSKGQAEGAKPVELYSKTYTKADGTEEIVLFNSDKAKENKALEKEDEEDEAVNEDDQSNEMVDETGELVEAPENNEKKPETNLKRKNAMLNGSTPPKKQKQDTTITTTTTSEALNKYDTIQIYPKVFDDNTSLRFLHDNERKSKNIVEWKQSNNGLMLKTLKDMKQVEFEFVVDWCDKIKPHIKYEVLIKVNEEKEQSFGTRNLFRRRQKFVGIKQARSLSFQSFHATISPHKNDVSYQKNDIKHTITFIKAEAKQVTANAVKHVEKMKANVANIDASDVEEMNKAIKEISESISDMPEGMQSIVKTLSLKWEQVRKKLKK